MMNTDDEDKTPAESAAAEPAGQETPRRSRGRRVLVAVLCVVTVLIGAGCVTWYSLMRVAPASSPDAYVDIRAGDAVSDISARLHAMGMTTNDRSLGWYWRLKGGGSLREGRYVVGGAASMAHLYQILAVGQPLTVRVTFPEGYTVQQMAARLAEQAGIPARDFMAAAVDGRGVLLEGQLFPDTYDVLYAGEAAAVVARMQRRLDEVLPSDWQAAATRHGLTTDQLLTVASIVEREAKFDADRPLVASVIYNRLRAGMLLQMDATLGYVLPSHDGFYTGDELTFDSPYNTYVHAGLPPTPICNPGLASIEAAAHAPQTSYLYFLARPDGHCVFARTYAEHERNIRLYLSGGS